MLGGAAASTVSGTSPPGPATNPTVELTPMQIRRAPEAAGTTVAVLMVLGGLSTVDQHASFSAVHAQTAWRGLVIAPERRCAPYEADKYRYSQSVEDRIIDELGGIYGPYTGRWFATKSETDIEHMVARSEAHDSGLCAADDQTRSRFASDLLNLTLAGPNVNRYQKVDKDAAEWLPGQNRCWFAARVIAVRQKYELTIDQREADGLGSRAGGVFVDRVDHGPARECAGRGGTSRQHEREHRRMGRRPERARQLCRGAGARDRARDAGPPSVSVHARRRWGRRGL